MRALILNGTCGEDGLDAAQQVLVEGMRRTGWKTEAIVLRDDADAFCPGCRECWTETPGRCKADRARRRVAQAACASDLMIWLTPVVAGGYSPALKRGVDPLIATLWPRLTAGPNMTPFPALLGLGAISPEDTDARRTFERLVHRHGRLLGAPRVSVGFLERARPEACLALVEQVVARPRRFVAPPLPIRPQGLAATAS